MIPEPHAACELFDLRPAEAFACKCLASAIFSKENVAHLFELLDKDPAPAKFESPEAETFSTGCYCKGGLVGLRSSCRRFPAASAFLCKFILERVPSFKFSSVSLFKNIRTGIHRDGRNAPYDNLIIPITDFEGGGLWIEGHGTSVRFINDAPVTGCEHSVFPHLTVPAYAKQHCTLPWKGTRLVAVAFSVDRLSSLNPRDKDVVHSLGFPLPSTAFECSTCDPPPEPASQAPSTSSFLACFKRRVQDLSLHQMVFVEVFAGSAGLCKAFRQCGYPLSFGVDRVVSPLARAPGCVNLVHRSC